jgi:uncharacterized protein YndB with AHSA1/START domain
MTTATDHTGTSQDFKTTLHFATPAEAVLAALRTPDAVSSWWSPATGSAEPGGVLEVASRSGSRMLELRVARAEEGRLTWAVQDAPLTPEWVGTAIVFEVEDTPGGSTLHFCHHGLNPQCTCFDMCQEGWTHTLGSLVSYVEAGQVADAPDSFQSTKPVAASPAAVLAGLRATEGVSAWWGPATGSAEEGGTLEVWFLGGRQRIRMHVEPTSEGRVVWSVEETPLTPEWVGTTIIFDVEESPRGATLQFRHQGLTPGLGCYDMCQEGWTHYLGSLVSYAETGEGQPSRHGDS